MSSTISTTNTSVATSIPIDVQRRSQLEWEVNHHLPQLISPHSNFQDRLSNIIRVWLDNFKEYFDQRKNAESAESIKHRFVRLLKSGLKDPAPPYKPVDEEPLLGSDGHTYGTRWLLLFFRNVPEEFHFRSPLRMQEAPPPYFTVQPHFLAAAMVRWLKDLGEDMSHPLDVAYERHRNELPLLPTLETLPIHLEREAIRRNDEELAVGLDQVQQLDQRGEELINSFSTWLDNQIATERQTFQQSANQLTSQISASQEQLIQNLRVNVQEELTRTRTQLNAFEQQNTELAQDLSQTRTQINTARVQTSQINKNIDTVEKAIKKQKKNQLKQLGVTLALTAASMGAAAGACAMLQLGAQATLGATLSSGAGTLIVNLGANKKNKDQDNKRSPNP